MRYLLVSCLLLVVSCGAKQSSSFRPGVTTRSEVVALKGEPESEEVLPIKNSKMMIYANDEKYQLKGDIVTNAFKNPSSEEKLVLFWQHKFRECSTSKTKLAQDPKAHTHPEIELACPSEGISVIYTEGSDTVSRVVEYEKK